MAKETKIDDITDKLFEIENELDLFAKTIDGVFFWERLRFAIGRNILKQVGLFGQSHTSIGERYYASISFCYNLIKYSLFNNPYFAKHSDLLFIGHPRRKPADDGKWYDLYCDMVIEEIGYSYTFIEAPYLGKHYRPAATNGIRYLDFLLLTAFLLRFFKLKKVKFKESDLDLITKIKSRIDKTFNVNIDLLSTIQNDLSRRKSQLPLYKILLKKIKPKIIILVSSYENETVIEAGKALGITVIELQHGFIDRNHLGYSFPGDKQTKRTFPDYLFTFGDYWNKAAEYPINAGKVISVGYPYLEKKLLKYIDCTKKNQVLFISQGSIGKEMSKVAVELSKRDDITDSIVYKLHPGEYARWQIDYPWLVDSDIEIIDNDNYPLYKLFAKSRVQIAVWSTALYEGLAFGLKTIVLPLGGVTGVTAHLVKEKMAATVETTEELANEINNSISYIEHNTANIFRENALENIKISLDEIIDKK